MFCDGGEFTAARATVWVVMFAVVVGNELLLDSEVVHWSVGMFG